MMIIYCSNKSSNGRLNVVFSETDLAAFQVHLRTPEGSLCLHLVASRYFIVTLSIVIEFVQDE